MRWFRGHNRRQSQSETGTNNQVERFNRLLVYLFPIKSQDIRESRPNTPAPTTGTNRQQSRLRRPHTAPAGIMHIPHPHIAHHSTNTELPLDIVLHDSPIVIRGTGVDIESSLLRGIVKLSLPEDTDIKVVEIRCTGKSRVSVMLKESTRSQSQTNVFYANSIDLLEGDKSHPHTLKAGRHEFPFTFEIDSKFAASLTANFGMATIHWRIRATAVRPSFSTNYSAVKDITVVRSFSNEALEFQQTLEIENSWPEKLNYAVILPHKAWAAGDTISAILKFTPLTKGVKIASVKMSLQEKVKTVWKALTYEDVRVVCSKKEALRCDRRRSSTTTPFHGSPTAPGTPLLPGDQDASGTRQRGNASAPTSFFRRVGSRVQSGENLLGLFRTRTGEDGQVASGDPGMPLDLGQPPVGVTGTSPPESPMSSEDEGEEAEDVEMVVRLHVPMDATPSHAIAPIVVSHRVKWDVLILNLDGHYSELRCSLPVHLLAKEVLEETLAATNATRTALLGESHGIQVQEIVLPAYHDHTRDRVAIAELHDHALATNPLNSTSIPTSPEDVPVDLPGPFSSSYGSPSTFADQMGHSNVPRVASLPDASDRGRRRFSGLNDPADPTSCELYLSLGRRPNSITTPPGEIGSHPASQSSSRASSPERGEEPFTSSGTRSSRHHHFSMRPFTVFSKNKGTPPTGSTHTPPSSSSRPNSLAGTMNPSAWQRQPFSRSSSGPSTPSSPDGQTPLTLPSPLSRSPTRSSTSASTPSTLLGEYYDTVPEYAFAARGFLGGGITPLSSFRGLPSYDQAQRSSASSPRSGVQVTNVTSAESATLHGSSSSGDLRRRGSRRASISTVGERQSPPLPTLPPSPPSSRPSSG